MHTTSRLQWKIFIPLVGMLWLIIGITIVYFVVHEQQRQKNNLELRLLNVNNTVLSAYELGADLQQTVDFIQLFTDNTTLDSLRITVYDKSGRIVADNPNATIHIFDSIGNPNPRLAKLWNTNGNTTVTDMAYHNRPSMISATASSDEQIHTYAALPYQGAVIDYLSIDPAIWIVVIILGLVSTIFAYIGVRALCRNVESLNKFASDIASDKLSENLNQLKFSNDELGNVSRNLVRIYREKINAELEKLHHENQISMNVSHELKTPVGIIKGYIDTVLADNNMPADIQRHLLERAQQNVDRLSTLIGDITMIMKMNENTDAPKCVAVNMHKLVETIASDLSHSNILNGMKFNSYIPEGVEVMAQESLLTNALLNLIYNSLRHSEGTEMSLRWINEHQGMHQFEFSDNGIGVPTEHLSRLFDLFYRVDAGRSRKQGGTGLGLPLVQKIIKAMAGEISVSNTTNGSGLQFTILLPKA